MLRAIVFDFDGVLADSEPLHYRAFRDVLAGEHVTLTEADYYARYLGFDDFGVFRAVGEELACGWGPGQVAELVARKAGRLAALEQDVSVLFPGAARTVRLAAAAFPLAIASGALGAEIRRVLDREQLTACFSAIVAAEDTPFSKPSPDPYLRAVSLLSSRTDTPLLARECVALEDSQWGLQSAQAAGLRTVAVAQTYPADALAADLVIDSVDRLDLHALSRLCSD
jgi:beta-phosphoglucomutase